ncbi:MAG TPA: LemA family protein [Patescibacteria group bacterium]|nr:LemA family protein [Patescibacteria group bacterium]
MSTPLILGIVVLLLLIYLWFTYNNLVTLRERIKEALSQIDIQLKRRADLIPNLVETVKGYAKHEKDVLENVTKARASLLKADSLQDKAKANNQITEALKSVFAIAESYPDLKASQNFLDLQQELTDTENKVSYSRQFYNANVLDYNTTIKKFPAVFIANQMGFKEMEFFAASEEERKEVKVKF